MEKTYIQPELPDGTEITSSAQESEPIFDERELVLEQYVNTPMAYTINGETYYAQGSHHAVMLCEFLQNERLPAAFFAVKFGEAANLYTTLEKDISDSLEDELSELTQSTDAEKDPQPQTENTSDSAGVIESGNSEARKVDEKPATSPWMPPQWVDGDNPADNTPKTEAPTMPTPVERGYTPMDSIESTAAHKQTAANDTVRTDEASTPPSEPVNIVKPKEQMTTIESHNPVENRHLDAMTLLQPAEGLSSALSLLAPKEHSRHNDLAVVESSTVELDDAQPEPPLATRKSEPPKHAKTRETTDENIGSNAVEVTLTTSPGLEETFIKSTNKEDGRAIDSDNDLFVPPMEVAADTLPVMETNILAPEELPDTIDMILKELATLDQGVTTSNGDTSDDSSEKSREEKIALLYKCYEAQVETQGKIGNLNEETPHSVHHALVELLQEVGFEEAEMHARIYLEKYGTSSVFDTFRAKGLMGALPQDFSVIERYRQLASLAVGLIIHRMDRRRLPEAA